MGAREKWLYFSYTLNVGSYSEAYTLYKLYALGDFGIGVPSCAVYAYIFGWMYGRKFW